MTPPPTTATSAVVASLMVFCPPVGPTRLIRSFWGKAALRGWRRNFDRPPWFSYYWGWLPYCQLRGSVHEAPSHVSVRRAAPGPGPGPDRRRRARQENAQGSVAGVQRPDRHLARHRHAQRHQAGTDERLLGRIPDLGLG